MAHYLRSQSKPLRWASLACAFALLGIAAAGCGNDDGGTDINVPAPGSSDSGGTSDQTGGSSSHAGKGSNSEAGMAQGGAPEGGAPEGGTSSAGTGVSAGTSSGGHAGTANGGATNGGNAGSANEGSMNGGSSGSASGGSSGAANGGSAGSSGTAGGGSGAGGSSGSGGGGNGGGGTGGGGNQTCGNGSIDGTEQCDDSGPSRTCSDDCITVASQDCVDCEQAGDCGPSSDNCNGPKNTPFTKEQTAICYDVLECILADGCLKGTGSLGECYCGTLSTAACGAAPYDLSKPGAPNGKCAAVMQKGQPGVTSNSIMLSNLTTKSRPAGAAGQRLNCDKSDMTCAPLCNVQ